MTNYDTPWCEFTTTGARWAPVVDVTDTDDPSMDRGECTNSGLYRVGSQGTRGTAVCFRHISHAVALATNSGEPVAAWRGSV